jgi:hypothetical protein
MPPLLRSLPHVESLSLFHTEEPEEETEIRRNLGLQDAYPVPEVPSKTQDVHMEEDTVITPFPQTRSPNSSISNTLLPPPTATQPVIDQPMLPKAVLSPIPPQVPANLPKTNTQIAKSQTVTERPPPIPSLSRRVASTRMDEDEAEDMPTINMESDSDADL